MKNIKSLLIVAMACMVNSLFSQEIQSKQDEKTQLFGFVDSEDKYIVNPIYKEVDYNFGHREGGLFKVVDAKDKIGYVNEHGKLIVPCKYDIVDGFEKGFAVVRNQKDEYEYFHGLVDSTGKEVIPVKYGRLDYYPEDKVLVFGMESVSDVGLMNLKGEIIIPAQYVFWSKMISKGLWPVGKEDKCGVVNLKNQIIIPFEYGMIESFSDKLEIAAAQKEAFGKTGFIDRTGKTVIPFEYEFGWTSDNYIIVKKNGKWGMIDRNSKIILPFEYAQIISSFEKTAWVIKNEGEEMVELELVTK